MSALIFITLSMFTPAASAVPGDSVILGQILNTANDQLKAATKLVENSNNDSKKLEQAANALAQLSAGINQSIAAYQGTQVYEQALLRLQNEKFAAPKTTVPLKPGSDEMSPESAREYERESLRASASDLETQKKLAQALQNAGPAFVGKLGAQAQLGSWQTNTRLSAQLTQMLSELHSLRGELKAGREATGLDALMKGVDFENSRQREGGTHVYRQ